MRRTALRPGVSEYATVERCLVRMMGARSGPHLLSDEKSARGYRLIEAARNLLLAAQYSEVGHYTKLTARLDVVLSSIEKTMKEIGRRAG